jgi:hypothetical protein
MSDRDVAGVENLNDGGTGGQQQFLLGISQVAVVLIKDMERHLLKDNRIDLG